MSEYRLGVPGPRPYDPREEKYRLSRTTRAVTPARTTEPILDLLNVLLPDPGNQGSIGSCAAASSEKAARMAARLAGMTLEVAEQLHWGWLYYYARAKHGWQNQDSGSYVADNLDLLAAAAPVASAAPYVEDAVWWTPPAELESAPRKDYVLSHRPFYPSQEGFNAFVTAWRNKMPVVASMWWPREFFEPGGPYGVEMPEGIKGNQPGMGAHAVLCLGSIPDPLRPYDPWLVFDNQWGPSWCPNAQRFHSYMRPGMFVMRLSTTLEMVFEARAVSFEPIVYPDPEPQKPCREQAIDTVRAVYLEYFEKSKTGPWWKKRDARLGASAVESALKQLEVSL